MFSRCHSGQFKNVRCTQRSLPKDAAFGSIHKQSQRTRPFHSYEQPLHAIFWYFYPAADPCFSFIGMPPGKSCSDRCIYVYLSRSISQRGVWVPLIRSHISMSDPVLIQCSRQIHLSRGSVLQFHVPTSIQQYFHI